MPRVAVENPVMNPHAREGLPADLPRPQIVQPWWFGDPFFKATGFYLRGLPPLVPTNKLGEVDLTLPQFGEMHCAANCSDGCRAMGDDEWRTAHFPRPVQ